MKKTSLRSATITRAPTFLLILLLVAMTAWITGCSTDESPTSASDDLYTRDQTPDVNDAFGGFNLGDEDPAFGDPNFAAEFGDDPEYTDPFENDATIRDLDHAIATENSAIRSF